ncbi:MULTISPECIES: alpha/beta fold hydrolase [unclassified Nocardia]|uniref:alpha/beta fold hydrolase n=1 Tax=unclassified Nocardia TaxID=2637762 RepID=UPI001CE412CE|nr:MULTISPECIES: alpha/beta hydrolase [unclassified Nocardia]
MSTLHVPGADLYYEVTGSGPLLLVIPGGSDDARDFTGIAEILAERYTVVGYDTRGISRSPRADDTAGASMETEVDDASRLLTAVGGEPAHIFGTSAGAQIALAFAIRYPDRVKTVVAHEPPAARLLPDDDPRRTLLDEVQAAYREHGTQAAMQAFAVGAGLGGPSNSDAPPFESERGAELMGQKLARMGQNVDFFYAHRVAAIGDYVPDATALRALGSRIVVGVGESSKGQFAYDTALALCARIGIEPTLFPGGHPGYATHPSGFAHRLEEVLTRTPVSRNI